MNHFKRYLLFSIGACCLLASCRPKTYHAYYTFGPIQAIGNQNKLYVFLEMDRMVSSGENHYDAPGSYPVGHKQELLIFDKDGLSDRISINTDNNIDGVSVHPNLTRLFAYDKNIYVFKGESYDSKKSIFRWDSEKAKFVLLSLEEGQALLNKFGARGSSSDVNAKLREISQNAGWTFSYQNTFLDKEELKWNGNTLHVFTSIKEGNLEVLISLGDAPTKVLTYPIQSKTLDTKQFDGLSREACGHPK